MSIDKDNEMLKEMLERILFDEKKLNDLKNMLTKLNNGTLTVREFKENIIIQRQEMFHELIDFFPFYVEHLQKSRAIDTFITGVPENSSLEELKARDDLLIESFNRLIRIREKLKIT